MSSQLSKRANFWHKHIEAAKSFPGNAVEYCAQEKIRLQSFYQWRRRFAALQIPVRTNAFAPVELLTASRAENLRQSHPLPDPKWAAIFVSHLLREMAQ